MKLKLFSGLIATAFVLAGATGWLTDYSFKTEVKPRPTKNSEVTAAPSTEAGDFQSPIQLQVFQPGTTSRFDINSSTIIYSQTLDKQKVIDEALYLDLQIQAVLTLSSLKDTASKKRVTLAINNITATKAGGARVSQEILQPELEALQIPFFLEFAQTGAVEFIYFGPNESNLSSGVKRALSSQLQFVNHNAEPHWITQEISELGHYKASYFQDSPLVFEKHIESLLSVSKQASLNASPKYRNLESKTLFYFSNQGVLNTLFSYSSIALSIAKTVHFRTENSIEMSLLSTLAQTSTKANETGYVAYTLDTPPEFYIASNNENPVAKISPNTFFEQLKTLLSNNTPVKEIWNYRESFFRSLQQHPELVNGLHKEFTATTSSKEASFLLGVLSDLDTAAAQHELLQIQENEALPISIRASAVTHLAFVKQPSIETLESLNAIATDLDSPEAIKQSAILSLGAAARASIQSSGNSNQLADDAIRSLINGFEQAKNSAEKATYLNAIGNAAPESFLPQLINLASQNHNESDKAIAMDSLRFYNNDSVDSLISNAIQNDSSNEVKLSAIHSSIYRNPSQLVNDSLYIAAESSNNAAVQLAALQALEFREPDKDRLINTLQIISQSEAAPEVIQYSQDTLKHIQQEEEKPTEES